METKSCVQRRVTLKEIAVREAAFSSMIQCGSAFLSDHTLCPLLVPHQAYCYHPVLHGGITSWLFTFGERVHCRRIDGVGNVCSLDLV